MQLQTIRDQLNLELLKILGNITYLIICRNVEGIVVLIQREKKKF